MIILPPDTRLEISLKLLDIYGGSKNLDDFLIRAREAFSDDPTLSYGFWIGMAVARIEQKTKIANDLIKLSEKHWAGQEIRRKP